MTTFPQGQALLKILSAAALAATCAVAIGANANAFRAPTASNDSTTSVLASEQRNGCKATHLSLMNGTPEPIWIRATDGGNPDATTYTDKGILRPGQSIELEDSHTSPAGFDIYLRIYRVVGNPDAGAGCGSMLGYVLATNPALGTPYFEVGASQRPDKVRTPYQSAWSLSESEGHEGWYVSNTQTKVSIKRDSNSQTVNMKMSIHQLDQTPSYDRENDSGGHIFG